MAPKNELQLESGREIRLLAINQWGTYSGLLEGVPTKEMNEGTIKHTLAEAKRLWDGNPYLIQPPETPIELNRKSVRHSSIDSRHHLYRSIPFIRYCAR